MKIPHWLSTTLSFVLIALLLVVYLISHAPKPATTTPVPTSVYQFPTTNTPVFSHPLAIGEKHILVAYAITPAEQELGLSNTVPIRDDQGMLFIFPALSKNGFWMKDMNYSLDILWVSSDKKVTDIAPNLSPSTFPKSFGPKEAEAYVLEVPAGFAEKNNITIGTQLVF